MMGYEDKLHLFENLVWIKFNLCGSAGSASAFFADAYS